MYIFAKKNIRWIFVKSIFIFSGIWWLKFLRKNIYNIYKSVLGIWLFVLFYFVAAAFKRFIFYF